MASMKLRVRSASGGPTIRVQVPLLCSLQGLKDVLAPLISLPASSFSLSLNKRDEIEGPGGALLSAFGVTSGDLLFYIANPGRGSPTSPIHLVGNPSTGVMPSETTSADVVSAMEARATVSAVRDSRAPSVGGYEMNPQETAQMPLPRATSPSDIRRDLCAAAAAHRAEQLKINSTDYLDSTNALLPATRPSATSISPSSMDSGEAEAAVVVETDRRVVTEMSPGEGHRRVPIPDLLHRVLASEIGNISHAASYLVLAVHAVMLETGFVRVETGYSNNSSAPPGSLASKGYNLPSQWGGGGSVNLTYTLPELSRTTEPSSSTHRTLGEEALLRCQIVGNAVVVYGAVTGGSVHRVSLSVHRFLHENVELQCFAAASQSSRSIQRRKESDIDDVEPIMGGDSVQQPSTGGGNHLAAVGQMGGNDEQSIFQDIFDLWKEVKDSLSLPLLTFMCEKAGFPPPPSLLTLPTELKIKVLDSLPAIALANLACSCSELKFLAASEELWERKYEEEFGASWWRAPRGRSWKSAFVWEFESRKRMEKQRRATETAILRRLQAEIFPPGYALRSPSFSPHFGGLDYFQGLGAGPLCGGGGGGFGGMVWPGGRGHFRPSGNQVEAFPGNQWYWDAEGRHDVGGGGRVMIPDIPQRQVDRGGEFPGLGPS